MGHRQPANSDCIYGYRYHRPFQQIFTANLQHAGQELSEILASQIFNANANYRGSSQSRKCKEGMEIGI